MKTEKEIKLKSPITFDGKQVASLKMRAPKVKDQLKIDASTGSNSEKEVKLFALLCDCPMDLIEELYMDDYRQLQEAYSSFLS